MRIFRKTSMGQFLKVALGVLVAALAAACPRAVLAQDASPSRTVRLIQIDLEPATLDSAQFVRLSKGQTEQMERQHPAAQHPPRLMHTTSHLNQHKSRCNDEIATNDQRLIRDVSGPMDRVQR
jgi:hypothetical protein